MTLPTSLFAYEDCLAAMTAALMDDIGVRIRMQSHDAALFFRTRCHYARVLDRKQNAKTYDEHDPKHFASDYDRLVLRIKVHDDGVWLYMEKNVVIPGEIESLSGATVNTLLPARMPSPKALPAPDAVGTDAVVGDGFDEVEAVPEAVPQLRRV